MAQFYKPYNSGTAGCFLNRIGMDMFETMQYIKHMTGKFMQV